MMRSYLPSGVSRTNIIACLLLGTDHNIRAYSHLASCTMSNLLLAELARFRCQPGRVLAIVMHPETFFICFVAKPLPGTA